MELIRLLFDKGYDYVLLGKSSSHIIEAEFGICQRFNGRNSPIGVEFICLLFSKGYDYILPGKSSRQKLKLSLVNVGDLVVGTA